jgi:NDP-sugar pyrophosphorylase family protein
VSFPEQAMILAAGRATRLGALGRERAKTLIEIDGRPLLEHHLRYLGDQGVTRVVVNASHLAEQLVDFASGWQGPPALEVAVEDEPLGTAGGVIDALGRFEPGPLAVVYGDIIVSEPLARMGALHAGSGAVATLAVFDSDDVAAKGVVELEGDRITGFREKDPEIAEGWVNAGVYVIDPSLLDGFAAADHPDFGHDVFPAALAAGRDLRAHKLAAPVLDIGTPTDLARARAGGLTDS